MRWVVRVLILIVLSSPFVTGYVFRAQITKALTPKPEYRESKVVRGELTSVVNATGTIQPVRRVYVGANVSGPVQRVLADYNDIVQKGDLLAEIDPRLFDAALKRAEANLTRASAEVQRTEARLERYEADYKRAKDLYEESEKYISESELDQYRTECLALRAEIESAKAGIQIAEADVENARTNVGYTRIVAEEAGIILDRQIEEGQTVASSFQVPNLFVLAPRLDEEVYIHASVVEAEIGLIIQAQKEECPVTFTVDAYPDELFKGKIHQVRKEHSRTENIVTYPVIVSAANPDMRLLPGMTADISFECERRTDILKIPNGALRFYPGIEQVREEDRKLLEGDEQEEEDDEEDASTDRRSAEQRVEAREQAEKRHVWVKDGEFLRAVEVWTGLNDYKYTELVDGELEEDVELVTGVK